MFVYALVSMAETMTLCPRAFTYFSLSSLKTKKVELQKSPSYLTTDGKVEINHTIFFIELFNLIIIIISCLVSYSVFPNVA